MPASGASTVKFSISTLPILIGGAAYRYVDHRSRRAGDSPDVREKKIHQGLLYSSGLVAGEAIGGILIAIISLNEVSGGQGVIAGFQTLLEKTPERFDLIFTKDSPHYVSLPGLSVLLGGMWVMHFSYWGFNQYIIQRALAAKSAREAQKGIMFAAFLKMIMPLIIVLPGVAAAILAPDLEAPDRAYPTVMNLLPTGILGLVFAALIAAIPEDVNNAASALS